MAGTRKRGSGKKGGEDGQVSRGRGSKRFSDLASQVTGAGSSSSEPAAKKSKSSSSKNKDEAGQTLVKITIEHCTS